MAAEEVSLVGFVAADVAGFEGGWGGLGLGLGLGGFFEEA